jgi:hypothetical protein
MGERGVWFLVVLGSLVVSFLPANKKAAGSRSIDTLSQAFLPHLSNNEVDGESEGVRVSYAGTSLLVPWRGLASVFLAPNFSSSSCWNNFELLECFPLSPVLPLAMVAEKENLGGTLLLSLVECNLSSSRLRHRGGGRAKGAMGSCTPREDQAAATGGVHQWRRRGAAVISGRRDHSVLWCFMRLMLFNLLAGEPYRRSLCVYVTAFFVALTPSGVVPGAGAGGRGVELIFHAGGEDQGPDCFFYISSRVLYAFSWDCVVFLLFCKVLCVILYPPTKN